MLKAITKALCLLYCCSPVSAASIPKVNIPPESAIQAAAKIPTGQKLCSTKFFPQPVHHDKFNGDWTDKNTTFLQQYQVIDKFYKPGGPILFYQSPEDAYSCVEYQAVYTYAEELGALAVGLEHRYFGASCPYGLNYSLAATWETSKMDAMTLDNVLSDGVAFLTWLTAGANPIAKGAKVIAFGASYGGSLAAMYRTHYPEIVFGSVASSPLIEGAITDPKDPLVYGFANWANMVYNDLSAEAAHKIKTSIADVRNRVATGKFDGIQEQLKLCNPVNSTSQAEVVSRYLLSAYIHAAQYNAANTAFPMDSVINATLLATTTFDILGAAIPWELHVQGATCATLTAPGEEKSTRNPFDYAICTYVPYSRNVYATAQTIFGPHLPDTSAKNINQARCKKMWGIDAIDGGLRRQKQMKLDKTTLQKTTHLLISEGMYDPGSAVGFGLVGWQPSADRNASRVFFISQGSHGAEAFRPNATDPEAVVEARKFEVNSIKEWLGMSS
ncbi:hypothetical protein A1O7_06430 [Cladophialophora yegresii CBS 114405]|uniref:Uncharacterized protein n=1 Tax=Cladophialophora yegresii CBS 114405 TaxID=1182544 RepID=W9WKL5_9EURO|nr:uncharacterized protein A1O7_06430 [Cladophialophora yegresii CBS 114405]EXJ58999.1 hypothetical protein A1O7_06430 [Cladophialophora yegresii CBS 114405]